jgi:hypothetical protein
MSGQTISVDHTCADLVEQWTSMLRGQPIKASTELAQQWLKVCSFMMGTQMPLKGVQFFNSRSVQQQHGRMHQNGEEQLLDKMFPSSKHRPAHGS